MNKLFSSTLLTALLSATIATTYAADTYVHVIKDIGGEGLYEKSPDLRLIHMPHFDNSTPAYLDTTNTNKLIDERLDAGNYGSIARRYDPNQNEEDARYWVIQTTDHAIKSNDIKVQIGFTSAVASGGNFRVELIDETGNGTSSYHVNCSQGQSGSHCGWHNNDKIVEVSLTPNTDRFTMMKISGDSGSFNNPTYQVLDVNCLSIEVDGVVSQMIPKKMDPERCSN